MVDNKNNNSNKDDEDNKELSLLKVLEEEVYISVHSYTTPLILDSN